MRRRGTKKRRPRTIFGKMFNRFMILAAIAIMVGILQTGAMVWAVRFFYHLIINVSGNAVIKIYHL